ncbi:AzlC family ABC transporter permease [Agrilactobacillus fermenti]|uniref:AzlC family ABC transporter permease n=1 Tax=Agrilactobacillus fermenti TaxID=2586909 RepID=UPI001E491F15|nr:AzlC family ABC transporter permease [Agrilactobacillus fermenti]MCD2255361.1 AzlC family ABC transporter permease [Agrilactobacillus fermenti]
MDDVLDARTGLKDTLPTVFGYIGIGLAFGIVGKASGLSPLLVALMSAITYGGSAQFVMVSMLVSHSTLLSIILAVFLVNARMILMSMTVAPYFRQERTWHVVLIGSLLTDETFALSMNKLNRTQNTLSFPWFNTANLTAYFTWIIASLIGALLGNFITDPKRFGLDFALVAMFIGLLYLQIIADQSMKKALQLTVVLVTCILMYIGLIFIPSNFLVLVVTLLSCGLGMVIKHVLF